MGDEQKNKDVVRKIEDAWKSFPDRSVEMLSLIGEATWS